MRSLQDRLPAESATENTGALKILVAEDSAADRLILQSMLQRSGHEVVLAEDGESAITAFSECHPDLVFLDVIMPNVNGIEAARRIKSLAGDELVPVIFLTSLADAESLATCLDAGGDDFLSKPYNQIVLDSKIKAFSRMREMHRTVAHQKDQIALHNKHLIQEQNVAKQVFDKIAHAGALKLDIIRYYMSALAVFNGDVLLAEVSPRGSLFVVLGDFTGHGLPAAIGSMPLAATFYGMVGKGFSLADILREINQKLYQTLPVGLFCCATCVDINFKKNRISVWNGGLPDNILYRHKTRTYERVKSSHLPLGVLSNRDFKADTQVLHLEPGDHFLMWSDGIQEARNRAGVMFGEDNINAVLDSSLDASAVYAQILKNVQEHIGSTEKDDDISLVDITFPEDDSKVQGLVPKSGMRNGYLEDWELTLTLVASSLKTFNPLSLLIHVISEVPGLRQNSSVLYTVLSELFNNALEHGVLGLESSIKSSPTGFAEYYRLRKEGLEALTEAFVRFEFRHEVRENGGMLTITVVDSGKGFVPQDLPLTGDPQKLPASAQYYGRGLTLVASICDSLQILPPGNRVRVQFSWNYEE
ncbi:response regulator [Saccharophagus sp. K07]|jgi:CheY-like chemotaxis protein/anti-sigma regulatory factor (Ser/Thr protein kinase)|uniref:ATP-binding SpoIIE family protein phosphatase n=1 Tax=Saccharophagus sp. K07 TaxID=2283636 RepID=UPI0016523FD8|nr:fused response regulator/phosphatase [Saccharophagus sp. K07]MBC6907109.1 response regulator [Saccharophagus sp. K07]